jgi:hypothetical protein
VARSFALVDCNAALDHQSVRATLPPCRHLSYRLLLNVIVGAPRCPPPTARDASARRTQGRATVRFRGGAVYDGAFAGGRMHDPAGRAVFPSGSVWRGGFDRGRWGP